MFGNKLTQDTHFKFYTTIFVYASDCTVCVYSPSDLLSAAQVKELKCDVWLTVMSLNFSISIMSEEVYQSLNHNSSLSNSLWQSDQKILKYIISK